ncbi:MAG TPA: hypothetical protein VFZ69_03225 [Longimicrobiales bacterium]
MNRLYALTLPLIAATGAIPTIPTLRPPGPPTNGIVATAQGTVFFVDSFHRTVWRLDPGRELSAFVSGFNGRALQVDEDGNLYGTHEDNSGRVTIWRADCRGGIEELAHNEVPQYGHAFVVEEDGDVIASSGSGKRTGVRLWRASAHESHLIAGGEMGFRDGPGARARFFPIGSMTLTPDGDLLVTSGHTIRRVRVDGSVTTIAADERLLKPRSTFLSRILGSVQGHLSGIAVGTGGEIYVANSARNSVVRIAPDGTAEEVVTSDHGWTPTGVATANGSLYILEYGRGVRVRRIDSTGTISVVALVRPDRSLAASIMVSRAFARG